MAAELSSAQGDKRSCKLHRRCWNYKEVYPLQREKQAVSSMLKYQISYKKICKWWIIIFLLLLKAEQILSD